MALWARGCGIRVDAPSGDERLRSLLGVGSDASADDCVRHFAAGHWSSTPTWEARRSSCAS
jgi:hypothetical protein